MNRDVSVPHRGPVDESAPLPPEGRGTEEAWQSDLGALYRARAHHLIGHFASGPADRETARDIVHEAFAKLAALSFARRLAVLRLDAYLYRMCVNLLRDRGRALQTRELHREHAMRAGSAHNPLAELEHRDSLRRLEAAMLRLNPKTREIFLAKRLDGMTYAEIAARTGLSVKGVEKHMSKAIAAVDRAMQRVRS